MGDTRGCYSNFGELGDCDGTPPNSLNLLDIAGAAPFTFEPVRKGTLLEQLGSKTNHDHSPMAQVEGKTQSEPAPSKTEAPQALSGAPNSRSEAPKAQSGAPRSEAPKPLEEPQSGLPLPKLEFELGPNQSRQNQSDSIFNSDGFEQSSPERPPGRPPVLFRPKPWTEQFRQDQFPLDQTKPEQPTNRLDKQVNDLIALLPDHPIRGVSKGLLKGLLTGDINRQEVASAMVQFAKAYNTRDITNLPPVTSDDYPLGDASEISLRLRKASTPFNDALAKLDLKVEVIDDKGIVIRSRKSPQVNIGVRLTGEIDAFQGRLERKEYKAMKMEDAIAELKPPQW